jgi:hypothetical protein
MEEKNGMWMGGVPPLGISTLPLSLFQNEAVPRDAIIAASIPRDGQLA